MARMTTTKQMIEAYLKQDAHAYDYFDNLARTSPEGFEDIVELINNCSTIEEIAYVAAGPLEDLLSNFPLQIKEKLDLQVKQNPKFRQAIQGVWATKGSTGRQVLDDILKKYGLQYGAL